MLAYNVPKYKCDNEYVQAWDFQWRFVKKMRNKLGYEIKKNYCHSNVFVCRKLMVD